MQQKDRLLGIDFFKIAAAYGVVFIHGLGGVSLDSESTRIVQVFSWFSVPFFLACAFYFSAISLYSKKDPFLQKRLRRILVPFGGWTAIYLIARSVKQLISHDHSLIKLISDPIGIMFGSAGVQLYFLPMLATGTVAFSFAALFLRKKDYSFLLFLIPISLVASSYLSTTGNTFILGKGVAFQTLFPDSTDFPVLRVLLVVLAWIVQCLPYILISLLLAQYIAPRFKCEPTWRKATGAISLIFSVGCIVLIYFGANIPFLVILFPYAVFIFGFSISIYLESKIIGILGSLTFGIYLVHGLFTDGLTVVLSKLFPLSFDAALSPPQLFLFATAIFGISLTISYLLSLNRHLSKLLLGT
jgi:hypothetical protein